MRNYPLRILVVDDDEDDIFLVKEMLKEGLPESQLFLDYATKNEDAIKLIENGEHDVCLLDLRMGKGDGLSILEHLNKRDISLYSGNIFDFPGGSGESCRGNESRSHGLYNQIKPFC